VVFGGAGNIAAYHGDPKTTHISTSVFSATLSQRGQTLTSIRLTTFTRDDRWLIVGDNRFQWTSQDTFGLGTSSTDTDAVNAQYNFFRVYETAYGRLRPSVFAGGGLLVSTRQNIRPADGAEATWDSSPNIVYSQAQGLPADSSMSAGFSLAGRIDTRDSQIDARRGWYGNATYETFFKGFFGSDTSWQEIDLDARTYRTLSANGRHRLAAWRMGNFVVAGTPPYYDLPATGMDTFGRSGRGYQEGRFRGEHLVYGEVEYRTTLMANGLLGMVAFLNATTVSSRDHGEHLFDSVALGAGAGLRLLLNKRSRTALCADLGFGKDGSHGFYLAVQEAF
jgi:outer membrane protein assembly factor BamA